MSEQNYTLQELDEDVKKKEPDCRFCDGMLGAVESYDHDGGLKIEGYVKRQWVYWICMKCGQEWSHEHLLGA